MSYRLWRNCYESNNPIQFLINYLIQENKLEIELPTEQATTIFPLSLISKYS